MTHHDAKSGGELRDIAGHELGRPAQVVRVRNATELRAALKRARDESRPFVAMGLRATYWHNLSLDGAIVADMAEYARIVRFDEASGIITVESGMTLRDLDRSMRSRGYQLEMCPDAYGDTFVGSGIANGVTAGRGMLRGSFLDQVVGFELMLVDGATVQVGASRMAQDAAGGIGTGIPDLRSIVFGAEGALGVITEIDFALTPAAWQCEIDWKTDDDRFEEVLALASRYRRSDVIDTLRWAWDGIGSLTMFVSSRLDATELDHRIATLSAAFPAWPAPSVVRHGDEHRAGRGDAYDRTWGGRPGQTWERAARSPFFGIDFFVPYGEARGAWAWARALEIEGIAGKRVAGYFGRDGVNIGVHCVSEAVRRDEVRTALEARIVDLAAFRAIPYRVGRVWRDAFMARMDPTTQRALSRIARQLDPDATMNPGVGVFGRDHTGGSGEAR